jgi:hypothetical protein
MCVYVFKQTKHPANCQSTRNWEKQKWITVKWMGNEIHSTCFSFDWSIFFSIRDEVYTVVCVATLPYGPKFLWIEMWTIRTSKDFFNFIIWRDLSIGVCVQNGGCAVAGNRIYFHTSKFVSAAGIVTDVGGLLRTWRKWGLRKRWQISARLRAVLDCTNKIWNIRQFSELWFLEIVISFIIVPIKCLRLASFVSKNPSNFCWMLNNP